MALYNGVPSRLRSKGRASASRGTGIAYVPSQIAQVAQGDPSAVPAGTPVGTFVPAAAPDPNAAARAQFDTLLQGSTNLANANYGTALAQSIGGEGTFANRIGANLGARDSSLDPSAVTQGSFDWGSVEASNPFSQAALLQRSYHQAQAGSVNGLSAAGLGNSSAMQHAQGQNTFNYQQGQNTLQNSLYDYLTQQSQNRSAAGVQRNQSINDASLQALTALLGSS